MENSVSNLEMLLDKAKEYSITSLEIYKLEAVEKSADIVSSVSIRLILILLIALFSLFINIGISFWIGKLLGATYLGFICVSSFYLMAAIIVYLFRDQLVKHPVHNYVIKKLVNL